jgi:ABC-type multidrug transport system fused ATPase/permease subunit
MSRDLWLFFLGLLLAIPLSIAANVLTRKYDDIRAKRDINVREKKLRSLIKEYSFIKGLKNDQSYAIFTVFRWVMRSLFYLALLVGLVWTSIVVLMMASLSRSKADLFITIMSMVVTVFWFVVLIRRANLYMEYLSKFSYFSGYQRKVFEQVEKLGRNVEELKANDSVPLYSPQDETHF